jgi:hypothetical protein
MTKEEIFKIQVPIEHNLPEPLALVYNKDRTIQFQAKISDDLRDVIGDRLKIYVIGLFADDTFWFKREVEAPRW